MHKNAVKLLEPYVIMRDKQKNTIEVNLYGEVVQTVPIDWWTGEKIEGLFIELKQFLNDLDSFREADEVTFRINSVGGDVEAGISIYNRIRELSGHTTTIVDGIAASAASIIAQAGDSRKVNIGAQTMIHGASAFLYGYYNVPSIQKVENMLNSINMSVAGIYADRTGLDTATIARMMKKESWMTPEEAVENGFADEITGSGEPVIDKIEDSTVYLVNGVPHNLREAALPDHLKVRSVLPHETLKPVFYPADKSMQGIRNIMKSAPLMAVANGHEPYVIDHKEGEEKMDLQELKANHPELVEAIRNEALATAQSDSENAVKDALDKDRLRMQEIDSIAKMVGDPAMVEKAKYTEPISASELAFKAMQAQQAAGRTFLANREDELAGNEISTPANSGMEDTVAEDEAELNAIINKIKEGK